MFWPCETRTSTCRNFATISSGVYRFFGIAVLLHVKRHSSGRTTSKREDQFYQSLSDEQKERFTTVAQSDPSRQKPDLAGLCGGSAAQSRGLPIDRVERELRLNQDQ